MGIQNMAGQKLGNYELLELIGEGGMGAVYSAVQLALKRKVAIKVLSHELVVQQPVYIERFNREAQTSARLEHAHIVPVYDYGTIDGTSFVVMRLLTGGTLLDRLEKHIDHGDPLPSLEEISTVLAHLASALDYAHSHDVIHRDIKPSNIMFDNQASTFIVDFGIAKLMTAEQAITKSGVRMGTPTHMAPEQWRVEQIVPATDQYALGVITYSMVTGRVPFEAVTPYALMNKHLNETPTPPRMFRPNMSPELEDALARAMAKAPGDRFPTCTAFAEAFTRAATGTREHKTGFFRVADQTMPAPPPKKPRESTPDQTAPGEPAARPSTPTPPGRTSRPSHPARPDTPTGRRRTTPPGRPSTPTPPGGTSRPSHSEQPQPSTEHSGRRRTSTQRPVTPPGRQSTPTPPGRVSRPSHPARPDTRHKLPVAPDPVPLYKTRGFWLIGLVLALLVIGTIGAVLVFTGSGDKSGAGGGADTTPGPTVTVSPGPAESEQAGETTMTPTDAGDRVTPSTPEPTQPVIVVEASATPTTTE